MADDAAAGAGAGGRIAAAAARLAGARSDGTEVEEDRGLHRIGPPPPGYVELWVLRSKVPPPMHPDWEHVPGWMKPLMKVFYGTASSQRYNYRVELERRRRVMHIPIDQNIFLPKQDFPNAIWAMCCAEAKTDEKGNTKDEFHDNCPTNGVTGLYHEPDVTNVEHPDQEGASSQMMSGGKSVYTLLEAIRKKPLEFCSHPDNEPVMILQRTFVD